MKIAIISDLHLEFYDTFFRYNLSEMINDTEKDHLFIAGDIHSNREAREDFLSSIKGPISYVMGNHDYYFDSWFDDAFEDDIAVGGCLWTNFQNDPITARLAARSINDFGAIKDWTVDRVYAINNQHKKHIFKSDRKIVLTHFPPTDYCTADMFKGDPLNGYFMNKFDQEILDSDKKLWMFGHIHSRWDFHIGDCRMLANPLGYPGEIPETFEIKTVEIDDGICEG